MVCLSSPKPCVNHARCLTCKHTVSTSPLSLTVSDEQACIAHMVQTNVLGDRPGFELFEGDKDTETCVHSVEIGTFDCTQAVCAPARLTSRSRENKNKIQILSPTSLVQACLGGLLLFLRRARCRENPSQCKRTKCLGQPPPSPHAVRRI